MRAVLFDLDGTLLDSIELILQSYRHTLAKHGLAPVPDAEILAGLGTKLEATMGRYARDAEEVDALIATYVEHNLAIHDATVRPYPGVNELVDRLSGRVELGLVTSKRREGASRGLAALGLLGHFKVLVCGDDVSRGKPDPEPVFQALSLLSVPVAQTIFVGDSPHDMHAGSAAGVATVAVTWGPFGEEELRPADPTYIAHDADQLDAHLESWLTE